MCVPSSPTISSVLFFFSSTHPPRQVDTHCALRHRPIDLKFVGWLVIHMYVLCKLLSSTPYPIAKGSLKGTQGHITDRQTTKNCPSLLCSTRLGFFYTAENSRTWRDISPERPVVSHHRRSRRTGCTWVRNWRSACADWWQNRRPSRSPGGPALEGPIKKTLLPQNPSCGRQLASPPRRRNQAQ